jgi:hypothetical protein
MRTAVSAVARVLPSVDASTSERPGHRLSFGLQFLPGFPSVSSDARLQGCSDRAHADAGSDSPRDSRAEAGRRRVLCSVRRRRTHDAFGHATAALNVPDGPSYPSRAIRSRWSQFVVVWRTRSP